MVIRLKRWPLLRSLANFGNLIGIDLYGGYESEARKRIGARDPEDWPILAAALALGCPIWTEDTDFFRVWRRDLDIQQYRHVPGRVRLLSARR